MPVSVAKGCAYGVAGCAAGCLAFVIGIMLMFGLFFGACVSVLPGTIAQFSANAVEVELAASAPDNSIDRIVDEVRSGGNAPSRVSTWRLDDHAWIRLGGSLFRHNSREARAAVTAAIERLERRGELPSGSVKVRIHKR
jgi:hypothetical protein